MSSSTSGKQPRAASEPASESRSWARAEVSDDTAPSDPKPESPSSSRGAFAFSTDAFTVRTPPIRAESDFVALGVLALLGVVFVWCLTAAVVIVGGATRMRHLRSYELSLFTAIFAVLPINPLFPLYLPFSVWALFILLRRGTREIFLQQKSLAGRHYAADGNRPAVPPKPAPDGASDREDPLRIPASGLIVVSGLNIALWMFASVMVAKSDTLPAWWLAPLTVPLLASMVMLKGALNMLQHQSYTLALAGAFIAILPLNPLVWISLPLGLWAVVALQSPQVPGLFAGGEQRRFFLSRVGEGRSSKSTFIVGAALLCAVLFSLFALLAVLGASYLTLEAGRSDTPATPASAPRAEEVHDESSPGVLPEQPLSPPSQKPAIAPAADGDQADASTRRQ